MKTLKALNIKLVKRSGMHLIYETPKGILWIGNCTNPSVYVYPGYYISNSKQIPEDYFTRPYKTARQAIIAAYNAIG